MLLEKMREKSPSSPAGSRNKRTGEHRRMMWREAQNSVRVHLMIVSAHWGANDIGLDQDLLGDGNF